MGIYKITNKLNGKFYIGSSINVEKRLTAHFTGVSSHQPIGAAIKKYGVDAFISELLEECLVASDVIPAEQRHLDELQPFGTTGYNIRKVAESNLGIKLSEETRRKMSEARKGKPKSPDTIAKMRKASQGRDMSHLDQYRGQPHSDETRRILSEKAMGRTWADDAERVQRHRELRVGKKLAPEHVEKVRQKHIGSKRSDEAKANMSAWQQRSYRAVSPTGEVFLLQSADLKEWLPAHGLNKSNFCKAVNTGCLYKGWTISGGRR